MPTKVHNLHNIKDKALFKRIVHSLGVGPPGGGGGYSDLVPTGGVPLKPPNPYL